ncbi:MAG: TonB-dependent receptor [Myroides sp.]|nr:TonB-dependent receptor [Myroides sp.]
MRFLLIAFFIIVTTSVHAQYKVYGTVYGLTGEPISNTQVSLHQGTARFITQSNGKGGYVFENIANGSYQIKVNNQALKDVFDLTVKNDDLNFDYIPNAYFGSDETLDDLVIQVESVKSKLEKEGFAVNIIETEEAALRNIQTNELLDRSVGVRVRQSAGLGSSVEYNLNGMTGNSVKIFIDGIPISTYGPSFNLNSIPPALIERIEVYKGVVPIHLSDDALGGAINVVLKQGVRNSLTASLSYGSFNTWQGNFSGITRNSKSGFTLKASSFYNFSDNDYEVWGKFVTNTLPNGRLEQVRAKRFNDAYRSIGGQIEAGFTDVSWADQFFVGFNASDSYREIQHGVYMTKPYMGRFEEADAQVTSLTYRKRNLFTNGLNLNVTAMYSKRHQVVNDTVKWNYNWHGELIRDLNTGNPILTTGGGQQGAATINHSNREVFNVRADLSYEINHNHRFVLNNMFYTFDRKDNDEMKSVIEREFVEDRGLTKNITGLAYEMKAFDARLKTNLFTKYYKQEIEKLKPTLKEVDGQKVQVDEHFNNDYDYIGYGIAASYLIKPAITVLGSYEKAIRLPIDSEIFGDVGENIVENNSLQAEVSLNSNLGFKVGPYQINKHKVSFGANGFIRDTRDRIVRQSSTRINDAIETAPYENLQSTVSRGFDIELMYEYNKRFILFANMSKFNTLRNEEFDSKGAPHQYYKMQIPNEPFLTASGSAQYTIPDFVQKNAVMNLHYGFNMIAPFYTNWLQTDYFKTPNQFIQDVGFSYLFPNKQFVLSFDVKNIFNRESYDNFASQKPGRAFYVKLNYSINKF